MDKEIMDALEDRIAGLLDAFNALKQENQSFQEEKRRLMEERDGFKARIDLILKKLEGI